MSRDTRKLMSDFKFYEAYSRFRDDGASYETWAESIDRVMSMHKTRYANKMTPELASLFDEVQTAYTNKLFLGAQRALQFGGEQLLKHNARLYNCSASYCDRPAFFGEAMYLMLCGCGVGFSVQTHHIAKIPKLTQRGHKLTEVVIDDSIEGWAKAIDILVSSYLTEGAKFPEYKGKKIVFDFNKIRPKGAFISGGFKAPGPEPLQKALKLIENKLHIISLEERQLTPIEAYDIVLYGADAVIAGGVRRSATICIFSKDDEDMLKAKTGSWFIDNPQRGRSNNSALLLRNDTSKEEFTEIMKSVKEFGEPGFIWANDLEMLFNPCVTDDTIVATSKGSYRVKDLIGKPFTAIVNGKTYNSTDKGFFFTGKKEVFSLKSKEGQELKLTANHKLLSNGVWKELRDLSVGDKVDLHNHKDVSWGVSSSSEREMGWLTGSLVGDGTFDKKSAVLKYWGKENYLGEVARNYLNSNFKLTQNFRAKIDKNGSIAFCSKGLADFTEQFDIIRLGKIPNHKLERQSSEFYKGYLQGLFDANGSVQGSTNKGVSVRLTQCNFETLQQVQRMLLKLGINSKIYRDRRPEGYYNLPDGKGSEAKFFCQAVHELIITKSNLRIYDDLIGFRAKHKSFKLKELLASYTRALNKDKFQMTIESITSIGDKKVYDVTIEDVHRFDANGIIAHNCVEIGMKGYTKDGRSGFEFCNLCEINGGKSSTADIFYEQCRVASIMGTLQAGYTDFKYLSDATKEIVEREALIGVSITGFMNNPDILLNKDILERGASIVKKWNKITAKLIGINEAPRTTCVKPSGNSSTLLQTSSGIHGEHSPLFIRNVQINKESDIAKAIMETNPAMVEDSLWAPNDYVISFPIIASKNSIYKKDLLGAKQLDVVKFVQQTWIEAGTDIDISFQKDMRHNVSNTITVDDWNEVEDYIYDNRYNLCGVSLLPANGDKAYAQAPFTEIFTVEQIVQMYGQESMFTSALIEAGIMAFNGNLYGACDTALGYGEKLNESSVHLHKREFVRRFNKFSKYFNTGSFTDEDLKAYDEKKALVDGYTISMAKLVSKLEKLNNTILTLAELDVTLKDEDGENALLNERQSLEYKLNSNATKSSESLENLKVNKVYLAKQQAKETCANCLKDVYNLHKWWKIQNNFKDIDWTKYLVNKIFTDIDTTGAVACSGGACEI